MHRFSVTNLVNRPVMSKKQENRNLGPGRQNNRFITENGQRGCDKLVSEQVTALEPLGKWGMENYKSILENSLKIVKMMNEISL